MRNSLAVPLLLLLEALAAVASGAPRQSAALPSSVEAGPAVLPAAGVAWLLVGGGYDPLSNQVSLAQDLGLARSLLAGEGVVLFAGGRLAPVAVLDSDTRTAGVRAVLARLFEPESAGIHFEPRVDVTAQPATAEHVLDALERSLALGTEPLLVYVASHGDGGEEPAQSTLSLWGGWSLEVADLAAVLDRPDVRRSARFVLTSCYGGGFAELIFPGAKAGRRSRDVVHCGLFAAPWDDEAGGCDPDPDRRSQEAYGIHFLQALAGRDRDGTPLSAALLDFDGDGKIGLLDAHTRARLSSRSIDVPTTTSERWLRFAGSSVPAIGSAPPSAMLPEERAVVDGLSRELGVASAAEAQRRLQRLEDDLERRNAAVDDLAVELDDAWARLRIALLERWPELDQPFSPAFEGRLRSDGGAILEMATTSPLARRHSTLEAESEKRWQGIDETRVERARVLRLVRAYETLELAARLATKGGEAWETFRALRSCERWAPPLHE